MEDNKKKPIMVGIIVVALFLAVGITFFTHSKDDGIDSMKSGQMIWVKCRNCGAEYQVDKKEYFKYLQEHGDPMAPEPPACKQCGEKSIYQAEKCEKCGLIFFKGSVPNDFADKCPECGYSKTEELRKKFRGGK
jgi:ribosomal protein L37E